MIFILAGYVEHSLAKLIAVERGEKFIMIAGSELFDADGKSGLNSE